MRLCKIFGVEVWVHWSILLPFLLAYTHIPELLVTFLSVALHEFGHIFAARYYGIKADKIILFALGGLAELQSMPKSILGELNVVLAGPYVTSLLFLFGMVTGWETLATINLILLLFNMLPAFPMDGGRALKACLRSFLSDKTATFFAMLVGWLFAAGFIWLGLAQGVYLLLLISAFIVIFSYLEYKQTE